ncbi:MAG: PAS domain S-box protein [Nitrospirota bacterium]
MTTATAEHSVLIVDDEEDIVLTLRDLLEHDGYRVDFAGTCAEAIARAAERHYNAVLLDLTLPDGDGLTVLKALQERDPTLPVIVLTADVSTDRRVDLRTQGAFDYLTKPYNRDDLRATLRKAVGVKALAVKAARVEHALTESQERFRSLVESATDAIVVADHRGRILSWNRAASTLFGYAEAEILGRPLTALMPARYREAHQNGLQRLRAGGETRLIGRVVELEGLRKDGSEFPLELSLATWRTRTETFFSGIIRDISERKRVQAALGVSEERFRSLVSNIPGAVYRCACDPHWTMEFLTDGVQDLCGYPASDFLGNRVRSYASVIHPDDRATVERQVHEAVAQRRPYVIEYRLLHSNGDVRWVYEKGQGVFEDGRVRWLDGVIVDITDRKRAEAALQDSEERYRALYEDNPSMYFMVDPDGRILSVNPFGAEQLGYTVAELLGRPVLSVFHAEDRQAVARELEMCLEHFGRAISWELRKVRKDGVVIWVRETARAVQTAAHGPVVLIVCEDITDRKRAEDAERESEERFRQLAEQIREVFWLSDAEKNRIYYVSPAYEQIWGRPCDALYASPRSWLDAIHPDDRPRVLEAALTKQVGGEYDEEYRIVRPDGSERWIRDRAFPVRDATGRVYRIAGLAEDITDRKRIEAALRDSNERLDLAVRGSTDGLWDGRVIPGEHWSSPRTPVWWSPRLKELLGFADDEFPDVLESWSSRLHPDDKDRVFAALTAHIERKEPYDVEYRLLNKAGEYRWFRARGQAVWDDQGRLVRMAGSLQCVTDRKRAEEALRASEERLRLALRAADLGVWDWDLRSGRVYWSETVEAFFGLPSGSFPGTHAAYLDLIYLEDRGLVLQAVQDAVEGRAAFEIEHRVVRPDGTLHWLAWSGRVMRETDGTAIRILGTVRDVTTAKQRA